MIQVKLVKKFVSLTLLALMGVLVILCLYGTLSGRPVTVMGFGISRIMSGSMEPNIMTGGFAVFRETDPEKLEVGDIVVFRNPDFGGGENTLYCHRIVSVSEDGMLGTRGDNNDATDLYRTPVGDVVGRVVYVFNGLGGIPAQTVAAMAAAFVIAGLFAAGAVRGHRRGMETMKKA